MTPRQKCEELREDTCRYARHTPKPDSARRSAVTTLHFLTDLLFPFEYRAGVREDAVATFCEREPAALALEERYRQFPLERSNGVAHPGLRDMQKVCRSAKAARLDDSDECTELGQGHMSEYS
jgi:hypothetical protein